MLVAIEAWSRLLLCAVFVIAGISKLIHREKFQSTLGSSGLVKGAYVGAVALGLPWAEVLLGVALLVDSVARAAALGGLALLTGFSLLLLRARLRGRATLTCGCFGDHESEQPIDLLLSRNLILVLVSILAIYGSTSELLALPLRDLLFVALAVAIAVPAWALVSAVAMTMDRVKEATARHVEDAG